MAGISEIGKAAGNQLNFCFIFVRGHPVAGGKECTDRHPCIATVGIFFFVLILSSKAA